MPLPTPPRARQDPITHKAHGLSWQDPYAWLRDPRYPEVKDPEILAYLEAENRYFAALFASHAAMKARLVAEMKGRIKEDDASVPVKDGAWLYHWRFEAHAQYRTWWRRPQGGGEGECMLDETQRASGHDFYQLGDWAVSPDGRLLAIAEDRDGSERYRISLRRLDGAAEFMEVAGNSSGSIVWTADSQAFAYVELTANHRPFRVRLHRLGEPPASDPVLYEEKSQAFFVGIGRTQSRAYLVISTGDHVTNEVRLIPAASPLATPILIAPRRPGIEYHVDHAGDRLFIRTNDSHPNFRIAVASPENPAPQHWRELIAPSDHDYIRGHRAFRRFLAVEERCDGLDRIRVQGHEGDAHHVAFAEENYSASLGANLEYDPAVLRLSYESMVIPPTVYDYDPTRRHLEVRKVEAIPSGYDPAAYATTRLLAPARDGAKVPVSLVHRRDFARHHGAPLHLYGYGAYGIGMRPSFSKNRISLLDRGFAYGIAHIRGGDELGHGWYQAGKTTQRWNSFHDFLDAATYLISEGYGAEGGISISGGSAGGTLMGVMANEAPQLWRAIVAHVPFVDVLNTMMDASLPLTPIEWPEWGNPVDDAEAFALIRSYSPYDNTRPQAYPPLMVTAGLADPRVTYWEPAKWVARLRAVKTDAHPLVLKTNMGAGHRGKTGRYAALEEVAEEYLFLLMAFERNEA
ncbi:MAG: S9 family peptidase [Pseudomonadota bacterium]